MKIAIAQIIHETNTFNQSTTSLEAFVIRRGDEIMGYFSGAHNEMTGFLEGAAAFNYDALPLFSAIADPSGTVTAAAFAELMSELLRTLRDAEYFDGILLALHGAFVSQDFPNADGQIACLVRKAFPTLPIVVTHDPHCNVSEVVPNSVDALLFYQTNPHVDQRERGLLAAKIVAGLVRGEIRPTQAFRQIPMMINIVHQNTSTPPLRDLWRKMRDYEREPGVLAVSLSLGYQYSDVPAMGTVVCVITDQNPARASEIAEHLASKLWDLRQTLAVTIPNVADAVAVAKAAKATPVVIVDIGDNVGGGSAADGTFVLNELLLQAAEGWVVVINDPLAVIHCATIGVGNNVSIEVGGKIDRTHGQPIQINGKVKCLHDGKYEERAARHGGIRWGDMGLTALLQIQTNPYSAASYVILTSKRTAPMSLHQLTAVGIDPTYMHILTVKAAIAWKAAYEPIMKSFVVADTSGSTQVNPSRWKYEHARKNLWGLEGW